MDSLSFDPETHIYQYKNKVVPSVTQILQAVGIIDYSRIDNNILETAMQRGKDVHLATQFLDENDLNWATVGEDIKGYVTAYQKFIEISGFKPEKIETAVVHLEYKYAGTLDRVGTLDGHSVILDIKTGSMPAWTGIQLAAYAACLSGSYQRVGLQLNQDGTFKITTFTNPNDFNLFLSALSIYNWKRK